MREKKRTTAPPKLGSHARPDSAKKRKEALADLPKASSNVAPFKRDPKP